MKIVINGIHANLRFSAAHMIPEHESCGCIHGHSYIVDVKVEGKRSGRHGFVADFKDVKAVVRELCSRFDHKLLIPLRSPLINFSSTSGNIKFEIGGKEYSIPEEDCCLLDLESSSAEELSRYFASTLFKELGRKYDISSVEVCVNEGIGQGAIYTISR
jgi:6-pyruvoyltetrahydropterin/6-carboxytetrahydropterin synthase